ncbi:MAG TPA: CBS domain-containing protein [Candidatus Omnitrophota bacterium]|nr:CBS domain-containing protein [Candidatus Omnitrophota bacterium]
MSSQDIISPPKAMLAKGDSLADAVKALRDNGFSPLPVVDAKDRFAGVFGPRELLAVLLPRAARLGEDDMPDLSFISDSYDDIKARLGAAAKESVGKVMAPHRTVHRDTPLVEMLLLLHRGDAFLPVVDESGKLVGVVTAAAVLSLIVEGV